MDEYFPDKLLDNLIEMGRIRASIEQQLFKVKDKDTLERIQRFIEGVASE